MVDLAINFKKSISDPNAGDIGNKTIQGMVVSKTIQLSSFTQNKNAVWAAKNLLQKESYPFATGSVVVNRDLFRLQVGDPFKLSFAKYGIVNMVCRLLLIEEESLDSEKITLHYMQDIFSVATAITEYTTPTNHAGTAPEYTTDPFVVMGIIEAPFVLSNEVQIVPFAARVSPQDLGMFVYMSLDGGASYSLLEQKGNIKPYGTLTQEYGLTNPIDDTEGIYVDFLTTDVSVIDSITWAKTLSGDNMALMEDELISFQNITPVSGTIYKLENVIRGRYGTEQVIHMADSPFWFTTQSIGIIKDSEIVPGVSRKFKLVPYNLKNVGSIAEALAIDLSITGVAKTPFKPTNFDANGVSFASRYTNGGDIVLTWTPRKRGEGAGVGSPGVILAETDREGFFEIEVWVSAALVRTIIAIDAVTWTYTDAMNVSDNGTPADIITFQIVNYLEESGITYTSTENEVICKKN